MFVANGGDYVVPQSRSRTYIVGVKRPLSHWKVDCYTSLFERLTQLVKAFVCPSVPLAVVLYDDSHPRIAAQLRTRQSKPSLDSMNPHQLAEIKQGWYRQFQRTYVPGLTHVSPADSTSLWFPCLALRKRAALELFQYRGQAKVAACRKMCDDCAGSSGSSRVVAALAKASAGVSLIDLNPSLGMMSKGTCSTSNELLSCTVLSGSDLWVSLEPDDLHGNLGIQDSSRVAESPLSPSPH